MCTLKINYIAALVPFVWIILSGASVFYCSSGSGTGLIVKSGVSSNHAPVATDSSLTSQVNAPVSGFMQASDADDDDLIFSVVLTPTLGVVNVTNTATGAFSYVSSATGSDSFSFKANDGKADSNVATVSIEVTDVQLSWQPADQADSRARSDGSPDAVSNPMPRCPSAEAVHGMAAMPLYPVSDPFDCAHLMLETAGPKLLRSTDGGLSWMESEINALLSDQVRDVLIHFNLFVPGLVYVAINEPGRKQARLARSRDGGVHWQVVGMSPAGHFERLRSSGLDETGCIKLRALFSHYESEFITLDCPFGS